MIKATAITIGFSEHPKHKNLRRFEGESCWEDAQRYILHLCSMIPNDLLGYYKTDFSIEWEDGSDPYEGRLDLQNPAHPGADNYLRRHIQQTARFSIGQFNPKHISDDDFQSIQRRQDPSVVTYFANLIEKYDIGIIPET